MSNKIVIVGGGSSAWSPKLLADLMLTPSLADSTYVLNDINRANVDRIARFARRLAVDLGVGAVVATEDDVDVALADADVIIITISTGGLDAMSHDLAIPEEYGIYHTVGDTVGPGGWARTLRNVPVFADLGRRIERVAPRAVVLNYTNPMGALTLTLTRTTSRPVVGLCHGVFENLEFIQGILGLESASELQCTYSGVNHFFFMTSLVANSKDAYPALREKLAAEPLPSQLSRLHPGRVGYHVAQEMLDCAGVLPYLADRHICEFVPQYLTSPSNIETYRIRRTTIAERLETLSRTERAIEEMTLGTIPAQYRLRSRETAADIANAVTSGTTFVDIGNLPNVGQAPDLKMGAVVETPVLVTGGTFRPVVMPSLPEPARSWVDRLCEVQVLTVDAALAGDLDLALRALMLDPLTSHLSWPKVKDLGTRLLKANSRYLPWLDGRAG